MPLNHDLLRQRANTLRLGIDQRLSELYSSYYPNSQPKKLINCLRAFLGKVDELIESGAVYQLDWICWVLEQIEYFLPDLQYANSEEIPRCLILVLQEFTSKLFPDTVLLSSPQRDEYNYGIEDLYPYIESYVDHLLSSNDKDSILGAFKDRIDVVRFPRIERDNILNYPIFGHELGHPIADSFLKLEKDNGVQDATKRLKEALKAEFGRDPTIEESNDAVKEMLDVRKRALEELISDCVGIFLFGPSAFFATYDLFSKDQLDVEPEEPDYYPPHRYRLRIMKILMDVEGYTAELLEVVDKVISIDIKESVRGYLEHIDTIIANDDDMDALYTDIVHETSYAWMEDILDRAIKYARDKVAAVSYSRGILSQEIPDLVERISIGVPPNEIGVYPQKRYADWRSSIIAGWLYKFGGYDVPFDVEKKSSRNSIDRLQRLTLRAVELCIFEDEYLRKYNADKGQ